MQFIVKKSALLVPLSDAVAVVQKKQTLPILANVKLLVADGKIHITANDSEREVTTQCVCDVDREGGITVSAHKLYDIARAAAGDDIRFELDGGKMRVKSGKGRYVLSTLPAEDFPSSESFTPQTTITLPGAILYSAMNRVSSSMASQDVRYYLNGMLFDFIHASDETRLHLVATDGHRLSTDSVAVSMDAPEDKLQAIIPRGSVEWVMKRLQHAEEVTIELGSTGGDHMNAVRFRFGEMTFSSKLIDGRFPDWQAVIPREQEKFAAIAPAELLSALQRVSVLSSDRSKSLEMNFSDSGELTIVSRNDEQEEAYETVGFVPHGGFENVTIGFNPAYVQDAVKSGSHVAHLQFHMTDANSSALLMAEGETFKFVVMPVRL